MSARLASDRTHDHIDLVEWDGDELWVRASIDTTVCLRRVTPSCPSCSCDWIDWNDRYLCGYQPARVGSRARHNCTAIEAWRGR